MASTSCELQLAAEAESWKVDETWLPLEGLFTVTPAIAGTAIETENDNTADKTRRVFMRFPLQLQVAVFAQTPALAPLVREQR